MICFVGDSHAAIHLRQGAEARGVKTVPYPNLATVIFVSEDTPTDENGVRNVEPIRALVRRVNAYNVPIVLTSQVPPGFTRSLELKNIWHQAETLRIKDSVYRAANPDYIAVGGTAPIPPDYADYLIAFGCPVLRMSWEDAEMTKIAVNMMLAAQVDYANHLSAATATFGADWNQVRRALHLDKRIGPDAYLTPGRWQDSKHLLRDWNTLEDLRTS